jgi:Predicted AAA-ATPase
MEEQLPVRVHNIDKPCFFIDSYPSVMIRCPSLYVDKTLLVEEFLGGLNIPLVLRPRRFGKSINLSMLSEFFSVQNDEKILKQLFEKTLIYSSPLYKQWAGTHPVIHVSFSVSPRTILQ